MENAKKPIALWSGPRNVSTALMYAFANRKDTKVIDEPFFGYFLRHTGVERPSREESLSSMETDFDTVLRNILSHKNKGFLFTKNMANHLEGQHLKVLEHFRNFILIRKPEAVLSSYRRQVEMPTLLDLCYQHQLNIIKYLQSQGSSCYVVDSDMLRTNPQKELSKLCDVLNISFSKRMLQWSPGPRKEDGVWAKYWYHNVHKSTGFMPPEEKQYVVPGSFQGLLDECNELYSQIKEIGDE